MAVASRWFFLVWGLSGVLLLAGCWRSVTGDIERGCTSNDDCDQGLACDEDGRCRCSALLCSGCCTSDLTGCRDGDDDSACGVGGALCEACEAGWECREGECVEPCVDECEAAGDLGCADASTVKRCERGEGGCLEEVLEGCPAGSACLDGACVEGCLPDCGDGPDRRCGDAPDRIEVCEADDDGCFGWRREDCRPGQICDGGYCVCDHECDVIGGYGCLDGERVRCEADDDNCRRWVPVAASEACSGNQVCDDGECVCPDACEPGTFTCPRPSHERECVIIGGCPTLGDWVSCGGLECVEGEGCLEGCNECRVEGRRRCDEAGLGYTEICTMNADACLVWERAETCGPHQTCEVGRCVCDHACAPGDQRCALVSREPNGYERCETDTDGCTYWSDPAACDDGEYCDVATGECAAYCPADCPASGATFCSGEAALRICQYVPEGDCLTWGEPVYCGDGELCIDGDCVTSCDMCGGEGDAYCRDDDTNVPCIHADGCWDWGPPESCGAGFSCVAGEGCVPSCERSCDPAVPATCDATGTSYTACVYDDALGCYNEVSTPCGAGETCNTACDEICVESCDVMHEQVCDGEWSYRICTDTGAISEACLEWVLEPCPPGTICQDDSCVDDPLACDPLAPPRCMGNGVQECTEVDGAGHYQWTDSYTCESWEICLDGGCTSTCAPCGAEPGFGCLEGNPTSVFRCHAGCWEHDDFCDYPDESCQLGFCVPTCEPCGSAGSSACLDGYENFVFSCEAGVGGDLCYRATPCGLGQTCVDGSCTF